MNEDAYASSSATVTISVQAFTPILGTLLLNENTRVGILARDALVGFLAKMNKVDEKEFGVSTRRRRRPRQPWEPVEEHDEEPLPYVGLFGRRERALFRQEILQQIVIGLGQLGDEDYRQQQSSDQLPEWHGDWSNPYFPPVSYESALHSTSDAHSSPKCSSNGSKRSPPSNSPRLDYSPGMELPSKTTSSSPSHSSPRRELTSKSSASGTPSIMDNDVYVFVMTLDALP
jgi:serine/threonine-protein phosphatase 4 regulatory subunit 1